MYKGYETVGVIMSRSILKTSNSSQTYSEIDPYKRLERLEKESEGGQVYWENIRGDFGSKSDRVVNSGHNSDG